MGKTAIVIDHEAGNRVTVVQIGDVPSGMRINGTEADIVNGVALNPATGKPLENVSGYVSELATLLTGKQSVDAGKPNPTQTDGGAAVRTIRARPGDALPIPGPREIINVELDHPLGIGSYGWKVPAGVSGRGWIKGRAVSGDNFAVRYALGLVAVGDAQLGPPVGSMELPINFGSDDKDGMSNTGPGFSGKLTIDNVSGSPMLLQLTRD